MIQLLDITKKFGNTQNEIFLNTSFSIKNANSVVIRGRSGSGKSTLLRIIAGIDLNYSGQYLFQDEILRKNMRKMADYRLKHIGIVTQNYRLLSDRNVYNNIAFPLHCQGVNDKDVRKRVNSTMELLNLNSLQKKNPQQLSGGECQRVAIARAIIKNPDLIIADEPTGALDETSEREVLDALSVLNKNGHSLLIATHSDLVAGYCDNEYEIQHQKLVKIR